MSVISIDIYNELLDELVLLANEVKNEVYNKFKYDPNQPHDIIKIPVLIRCKEYKSFYEKAYFRDKKYKNPINDITDKIGVRFVVLLPKQIKIIKKIILSNTKWETRVDKDIDLQIDENPFFFDYLSTHIIVKRNNGLQFSQDPITCEIQIRTLTQHAYSELTHDLVYKSPVGTSTKVKRNVGRCMALIDTTDQLFGDTNNTIEKDIKEFHLKLEESTNFCKKYNFVTDIVKKINSQIYNNLLPIIKNIELKDYENNAVFFHKLELVNKIENIYFKQPLTVFLVVAALKNATYLIDNWHIEDDVKNMLFLTLGISKYN